MKNDDELVVAARDGGICLVIGNKCSGGAPADGQGGPESTEPSLHTPRHARMSCYQGRPKATDSDPLAIFN